MKLGIDIDGPTADFVGACARVFGFDPTKVTTWDSIFTVAGFADGKEFFKHVQEFDVFSTCDPTRGSYETIHALAAEGHRIVFITARPSWSQQATMDWLETWFPDVDYDLFYKPSKQKGSIDCDIYLDDSPRVLEALKAGGKNAVAFDFPWNSHVDVYRVASWQEFHRYVKSFARPQLSPAVIAAEYIAAHEVRVTDPKTGGQKGQKPQRMDLLPYDALMAVSQLYGRGAEKYEDRNWERGYDYSLSAAAMMRHFSQWWQGEDIDPETLCHHLDSVVFHALTLRTYVLRGIGNDNRPLTKTATQE